jgi:hypothetical protein
MPLILDPPLTMPTLKSDRLRINSSHPRSILAPLWPYSTPDQLPGTDHGMPTTGPSLPWADREIYYLGTPSKEPLGNHAPDPSPQSLLGPVAHMRRSRDFSPRILVPGFLVAGARPCGLPV